MVIRDKGANNVTSVYVGKGYVGTKIGLMIAEVDLVLNIRIRKEN